ncbi:hypothetical protein ACH4E8_28855 [Streptomyces sp. NPDC017979]|uniref:hypothetical protein n=1 Tax=Streptomyces sp. NPDC017979 TaxID=3365024 RepID=UPI0037AC9337
MNEAHPDFRLRLAAEHAARLRGRAAAAALAAQARALSPPRTPLRVRMGWTLVEVGLRLVQRQAVPLRSRTA